MSRSNMLARVAKKVVPLLVCVAAAAGAVWLYRQAPGSTGIQGVAEAREYRIASIETGRLAEVSVELGQRVARGQTVAALDAQLIEQEIRVAEAELRELAAQVRAQGKVLDLGGLETERSFEADVERATVNLRAARDECARLGAELGGVELEIARQESLVKRRLASSERLQELRLRMAALKESVGACPSSLQTLESSQRSAEQRLSAWRSSRGAEPGQRRNQERLDPLVLRAARQQESLRLLRLRLDSMVLRSPVDGDVVNVIARKGDVLRPGDPVLAVVEARPSQVIAYVEEDRGVTVFLHDRAQLRRRDREGVPLEGSVVAVAASVSQVPSRFWPAPNRPRWARQVFIQVGPGDALVPGEAFDISFRRP